MLEPPTPARGDHSFSHHGITVADPYSWMRDPGYPDVTDETVLDHLRAENAYFDTYMAPHEALVSELFEEMKGRQPQDDEGVPFKEGDYLYQWRFEDGAQYRRWYRAAVNTPDEWMLVLDEVALAEPHEFFRLGGMSFSDDGTHVAYSADTTGAERFELTIVNLQNGRTVDTPIDQTMGSPVWANDTTLLYVVVNENWRPHQVRKHVLGAVVADDTTVYDEPDESFFVGLDRTLSAEYLVISAGDHVTSEVRVLPRRDLDGAWTVISPRRSGHQYDVEHQGDHFYIRTNDAHKNFRLVRTPADNPYPDFWNEVIAPSDQRYLRDLLCLRDHVLVGERREGLDHICVIDTDGFEHLVDFPEATYSAGFGTNAEFDQTFVRISYQSMVTPSTVFDYNLADRSLEERKVQVVPGGYDPEAYETVRLSAPARDGVMVPVSVVYRKGLPRNGSAPLMLYGYGAYGIAIPPSFSPSRLSLLDRGFAFAIAHIRGGDDLGYHWYEDGKLDKRTNTFNDFVDVAQHLIAENFTSAGKLAISGGSAGGELMGAVANQAPELWGAVGAHVPFVDVLNTMLDDTLPLTPIEWPEWGNPIEDKAVFEFIQSYSPYDQVEAKDYPPMFVTAGLNDPRVTYWEPAKWVAKLRYLKTDGNPIIFKCEMGAGHGGKSGRFDALRQVAEEYAFFMTSIDAG